VRLRSALLARRRFQVDLDQLDAAVLGLHFDSDVEEEVDVFAEVPGDAVDGPERGRPC
jgi:hypothetical protein